MTTTARLSPIEVYASTIPDKPPVDVDRLAADLGLHVIRRRNLGPEVPGGIFRSASSPSGYTIYVNSNDRPRRQRFTLAHEIAHFILHRDLLGNGIEDDAQYRSSSLGILHEQQANRMAADILMPAQLVKAVSPEKSPAELADAFDVSVDAMQLRLRELQLGR